MKAVFAIPGDLDTPTGGYVYDRRVMALLPAHGIRVRHLKLPGGFPFPTSEGLGEAGRILAQTDPREPLVIDGLALGVLPPAMLRAVRAPVIALLHHPLGLETGLSGKDSERLLAMEKAALEYARHVIVTSDATARTLSELGFAPPPPVTVATPGLSRQPIRRGGADVFQIVSIGSVVPRKGYDILVEALAQLRDENWRCKIVGAMDRDVPYAAKLCKQIADSGLDARISFTGVLDADAIGTLLGEADVFALPSRYEGYGMAFAEAMSHGVPVIAARAGAVPDTVPEQAGILVPPDDAGALANALHTLMRDGALRKRLGKGAWDHARTLPSWDDTASIVSRIIRQVSDDRLHG